MSQSPRILIVEDNPLDAELTRWALTEAGYTGEPLVVNDGLEALAALKNEGAYEHFAKPDLIILDLNLRLLDGPEVLDFVRKTSGFENTRVAILSSSPEYVMRSKASKADWYFVKSSSLDAYAEVGRNLLDCWQASCSNDDRNSH